MSIWIVYILKWQYTCTHRIAMHCSSRMRAMLVFTHGYIKTKLYQGQMAKLQHVCTWLLTLLTQITCCHDNTLLQILHTFIGDYFHMKNVVLLSYYRRIKGILKEMSDVEIHHQNCLTLNSVINIWINMLQLNQFRGSQFCY